MNNIIEKINALSDLVENINPTIIYNEGWMIRLLVIQSMIEKLKIKGIDFGKLAAKNWSSEALITSPFVETKENREGYTHADIILGDFNVNYNERGEVKLDEFPEILGIIEAKMGSNLSQGTTNAKNYNQASRNICCLSYLTKNKPDCKIFFVIAAPQKTIENYNIKDQIKIKKIKDQIEDRFKHSNEEYLSEIRKQVEECKILIISYEDWIKEIKDNEIKTRLEDFYNSCLLHNKINFN
jgi:hypothetical protein